MSEASRRRRNLARLCALGSAWAVGTVASAAAANQSPCGTNVVYQTAFNPESLNKWFRIAGTWSLVEGKLAGTGEGGGIDAWIYAIPTRPTPSNVQIDVDANMSSGNAEIVFNSTGHWLNEYRVEFWSENSPAYPNRYNIMRYRDGSVDWTTNNTLTPVRIAQWSHLTVQRQGNTISLFVNRQLVAAVTDPEPLPPVGMYGLGVIWDMSARYDNFTVRLPPCR